MTDTLKPITVSPRIRRSLDRLLDLRASIATAEAALLTLRRHSDPTVAGCADMLVGPLTEWKEASEAEAAGLMDLGGMDDVEVTLPRDGQQVIIGKLGDGGVRLADPQFLGPRVVIESTGYGWTAAAPLADHVKPATPGWDHHTWILNGEAVSPRERVEVSPGDVLTIGQTRVTLVAEAGR